MTGPAPAGAEPARPSGITWGKVLGGCLVGCLVLLVLLIGAGIALVRWATRETPLPPDDLLLRPEVTAYLAATADLADPGTVAFFEAMARPGSGAAPEVLRKAFPVRFAAALTGADPPRAVGVLSLSRYANLLRLPLLPARMSRGAETERSEVVRYRGEVVFRDRDPGGPPLAFAFAGGSILLGGDLEAVKFGLDRLKDRDGGRPSEELRALWPAASKLPIKGASTNARGELRRAFELLETRILDRVVVRDPQVLEVLGRATGASLTARPGSPQAGSLEIHLELRFAGAAAGEVEAVGALVPGIDEALRARGIRPSAEVAAAGDRVVVSARLDGLARALAGRSLRLGPVEVK